MNYLWERTTASLPSALNLKDGIGACVLNSKMYALGGWSTNGTRYNSVSFSTDGITWTPSAKAASWTPRHAMPVVAHKGRMFVIGGDQNSGAYQPDVHSWDGLETSDWVVETAAAPWGNRVGHIAFSLGNYIYVGFGQTITPFTPAPTTFFADLWRSETGQGNTWELVKDKCVSSLRGYFSSCPAILDGEAYFIGGGTYETTDFPNWQNRELKNDIYAMNTSEEFRLVNHGKGSPLTKLMYHNIAAFDGKLWVLAGWSGSDQRKWFMSDNKGDTWTQQPTPPWAARHAAMSIVFDDALYFGTGMNASDMWKLFKTDANFGASVDGTTALASQYTVFDKSTALVPSTTVSEIGFIRTSSGSMIPKIAKIVGNVVEVVWTGSAVTHSGGGYESFPITPFVVPNDGATYRIGFAFSYPYSDSFSHAGQGRWMKVGNITGTSTFSFYADGSFVMSWTEEP